MQGRKHGVSFITVVSMIMNVGVEYMKCHSAKFIKGLILASLWISMFQISCFAYAATQSESTDLDLEESLQDQEQTDHHRFHGHLGGEINYAEGIKNNARYSGRLIPLYRVEYDEWIYVSNIGGMEAGLWLWQTPDHKQKIGASVQRHPNQTDFDFAARRQASADGVIKFQWRMPNNYITHLSYHRDIGNASKGDSAVITLSRNILFRQALFNHDCMLVPGVDLEWESARLVDYYYGVRPEEATLNQHAYIGRETLNEKARLTGFYLINKSWTVFVGVQAAVFGSGITDSPMVKRRSTMRGYMGTAWIF